MFSPYRTFNKTPFIQLSILETAMRKSLEGLKDGTVCIIYGTNKAIVNGEQWTRFSYVGYDQPLIGVFLSPAVPRTKAEEIALQQEGYHKLVAYATELLEQLNQSK